MGLFDKMLHRLPAHLVVSTSKFPDAWPHHDNGASLSALQKLLVPVEQVCLDLFAKHKSSCTVIPAKGSQIGQPG